MIVAFAGHIASGKSTASRELADLLGWPRFSFGRFVAECASRIGLDPEDRQTLQDLGACLAARPERFCGAFLGWVGASDSFIIDGLRHPVILDELRHQVRPTTVSVVFLDTPAIVAERRYIERDEATEALHSVREHLVESNTGLLLNRADWLIRKSLTGEMQQIADSIRRA